MGATGLPPERRPAQRFLELPSEVGGVDKHARRRVFTCTSGSETKPRDLHGTDCIRLTQEAIVAMLTIRTVQLRRFASA